MIRAFYKEGGQIRDRQVTANETLPENICWLDLLSPDEFERIAVSKILGLDLPTRSEMEEIEASSRLYVENDGTIYLTTSVMTGVGTPTPGESDLTIVINSKALVTMRYAEPRSIEIFTARIRKQPELMNSVDDGLLALLDSIVDRTADILEYIGKHVDELSRRTFFDSAQKIAEEESAGASVSSVMLFGRRGKKSAAQREERLTEILRGIGQSGDMIHRVRDSLSNLIRLMAFLGPLVTTGRLQGEQLTKFRTLDRDLRSLVDHAQFLASETSFLLDATLGQINVEQNRIIKIFSVMSVAFLPPTMLASIWGMNFDRMPELHQPHGYYVSLIIIIISAIVPILYFKRRGWL